MLGSLPWEKLQDEGQQLQSAVLQNAVQRSPPLLSAIITSASTLFPGEEGGVRVSPADCV